jgi:4,5-DOPA dioxygenase extradiol
VIASGNVVHNLKGMSWSLADEGYSWAERFDRAAKELMLTDPTGFATLDAHHDYRDAVPTPDHFIPALYLAGLAGAADPEHRDTDVLVDGYAYGSLSMTAYTLGQPCPPSAGVGGVPQPPADVPPDGSNI